LVAGVQQAEGGSMTRWLAGVSVSPASAGARRFVDFVLGPQGRKTLVELGFGAP
jgi:ABC-type molybdate transport system substrate-binding protein